MGNFLSVSFFSIHFALLSFNFSWAIPNVDTFLVCFLFPINASFYILNMWMKDLNGLAKADLTLSSPNECLSDLIGEES